VRNVWRKLHESYVEFDISLFRSSLPHGLSPPVVANATAISEATSGASLSGDPTAASGASSHAATGAPLHAAVGLARGKSIAQWWQEWGPSIREATGVDTVIGAAGAVAGAAAAARDAIGDAADALRPVPVVVPPELLAAESHTAVTIGGMMAAYALVSLYATNCRPASP